MKLSHKTFLLTGACGGLGRATARALLQAGAHVALTDLPGTGGDELAATLAAAYPAQAAPESGPELSSAADSPETSRCCFLAHDVSSADDWARVMAQAAARLGPLDGVINNAAILLPGNIESLSLAHWQQLMRVNADSVFLGTQAGVTALKARGGSIVNIASVASWLPVDAYTGYSASKAAVAAVTRAAALHCRKRGYAVRVNSVHPDGIWTPMMEASLRGAPPGVKPEHLLYDAQRNPKGRACQPEEVASVVAFLLSDDARAINGAEMRVDNAVLGMGL